MNLKPADIAYMRQRGKDVYILFYINIKQMEAGSEKKNSVSRDAKITVLIFYIRIAFMLFNGTEDFQRLKTFR